MEQRHKTVVDARLEYNIVLKVNQTTVEIIMRCCGSTSASMVAQDHAESSLCLFCSVTIALHCWSRGAVSNLMRTLTVLPAAH